MQSMWLLIAVLSLCIFMVAAQDGDIEEDAVTCPPLPAPMDGVISACKQEGLTLAEADQQPFGASCEVECEEGLAVLGSARRTCLGDGTWDGTDAVCEVDPCFGHTCKKPNYAICISEEVDGRLMPVCNCPESCPDVIKPVCSVYGKQYDSLCHLRLYACKRRRLYPLAYQKPCVASQERCRSEELDEFPHRLLEWFLHLREIDELKALDPNSNIRKLDNAGRRKLAKWKFDLLDRKHDGVLDRRDLREFRYGLMPLEHCADDFFQLCNDGSRSVTIEQWNKCLQVDDVEEAPRRMAEFFLNVVPKESPAEEEGGEQEANI